MKTPKILLTGFLALSAACVADAQTVIHITGSTAFRNAALIGISNILQPGFTFGYAGTSALGANQSIYTGTTTNGIPVIIKTSWSGAVGGVQTVSQQIPISTWLTNSTAQSVAGASNAPSVYDPPAVPEVGFDDGIQALSPYPTPALIENPVGVVAFKWVRGVTTPTTMTNMTPLLAQALWGGLGRLPLSMWTGLTNDETNLIYAIGRDPDSGTRKTAFLESGINVPGVFNDITQFAPTNASGSIVDRNHAGPIVGQEPWPDETVNGIFIPSPNGGYSSGGDVAFALKTVGTTNFTPMYVSYLGLADATTAINGGGVELTWNGVPYSQSNLEEGNYTFWATEILDYRSNLGTVNANAKSVADLLANRILTVDAVNAGELLGNMHVQRAAEGGVVTPTFSY